jgi:hypothetical protein
LLARCLDALFEEGATYHLARRYNRALDIHATSSHLPCTGDIAFCEFPACTIDTGMPNLTSFQQPGTSRLESHYRGRVELRQVLATNNRRMGELEARLKAAEKVSDIPLDTNELQLGAELVDGVAERLLRKLNDLSETYSIEVTIKNLEEQRPSVVDLQNRRAKPQSTFDAIRASASNVFTNTDTLEVEMLRDHYEEFQEYN